MSVQQLEEEEEELVPCAGQRFKVITWARRRRRCRLLRSCPFKLLEHPFWRCHCQCHSNFLCVSLPPFCLLSLSEFFSLSPFLCGVAPTQCQVPHCQHFISRFFPLFACFAIFFIVPYNQWQLADCRVYKAGISALIFIVLSRIACLKRMRFICLISLYAWLEF